MHALLSLLVATTAFAGEKQANECVTPKTWEAQQQGWGIRTQVSADVAPAGTKAYAMTLFQGNQYVIKSCGDSSVVNLDILLYDQAGKIVQRDTTTDREPTLEINPPATGSYYVVLYAREVAEGATTAGVAMAVFYK